MLTASAMLAPSGSAPSSFCGMPRRSVTPPFILPLRLRPVEFEIEALSSISITTVRMSPRCAARRSPNRLSVPPVQSEEPSEAVPAGTSSGRAAEYIA